MTDMASREPINERGTIQSNYYMIRQFGSASTALIIAFGFSSAQLRVFGRTFCRWVDVRMRS